MAEASIKLLEDLHTACEKFSAAVKPAVDDFRRHPSVVSMGVNRVYAHLCGAMQISCDAKEFLGFLESMFSVEALENPFSKATNGITLKHKSHALEQRQLKIRFGDLDIIKLLDYNIGYNPDLIRLCGVVKEALKESDIIKKYEDYKEPQKLEYKKPETKPAAKDWRESLKLPDKPSSFTPPGTPWLDQIRRECEEEELRKSQEL